MKPIIVLILLFLVGCTAVPNTNVTVAPTRTAVPETPAEEVEEIAVQESVAEGSTAVYIINADSSNQRPLIEANEPYVSGWSLDGRQLTFSASSNGISAIYTIDVSSGEQRLLTPEQLAASSPIWSPDGQRIAFTAYQSSNYSDPGLYVIQPDGQNLKRLTTDLQEIYWPSWSPDGQQLLFSAYAEATAEEYSWDIYAVNTDGSHLHNLTAHAGEDSEPVWSPDKSKIAFTSIRGGRSGLYVMAADGRNPTRLTQMPGLLGNIGWSPDGTQLLFKANQVEGHHQDAFDIFVVNADGGNLRNLSNHFSGDDWPQWSPDGTRIAFTSDRDGNEEIYVMNADGSNPTRLTFNDGRDWYPLWSPDGNQLAFNHSQPIDPAMLPNDNIEITVTAVPTPTPLSLPSPTPAAVTTAPIPTQLPPGNLLLYSERQSVGNELYWALRALPAVPPFDQPMFGTFYGPNAQLPDGPGLYFNNFAPQPSPDGRYLALPGTGGYDNPSGDLGVGFWLADLASGQLHQLWPQARPFTWSPDSQAITFADDGVLYTLDVTDGTAVPTPLFTHPNLVDLWVRWSPDGRWIAVITLEPAGVDETGYPQQTEVLWLAPTNGEPAFELTRRPFLSIEHIASEIQWSPDSQYLLLHQEVINLAGEPVWSETQGWATWQPGQNQILVNRSEGMHLMTVTGEEIYRISQTYLNNWAISHNGQRLAYVLPDEAGNIFIFDLETGEQHLGGRLARDKVGDLRWTADDAYLVISGEQYLTSFWLLAAQPGGTLQPLAANGVLVDVVGLAATAVSSNDLGWLSYQDEEYSVQYPATWAVAEQEGFVYFLSPESFGEGTQPIKYVIFATEYPNPDGRPFPEAVTAWLSPELQQTFAYAQEVIGSHTVYRTTAIPSAEGALTMFFEGDGRYLSFALTPYNIQNPFEGQDQYEQLFVHLLQTVQLTNE
jgi:Tol biopolymer transport system component